MRLHAFFSGPEMQPLRRLAGILFAVGLVDCLYVLFAKRPLPWAGIIPAAIPLLAAVFVIIPMIRASKG